MTLNLFYPDCDIYLPSIRLVLPWSPTTKLGAAAIVSSSPPKADCFYPNFFYLDFFLPNFFPPQFFYYNFLPGLWDLLTFNKAGFALKSHNKVRCGSNSFFFTPESRLFLSFQMGNLVQGLSMQTFILLFFSRVNLKWNLDKIYLYVLCIFVCKLIFVVQGIALIVFNFKKRCHKNFNIEVDFC